MGKDSTSTIRLGVRTAQEEIVMKSAKGVPQGTWRMMSELDKLEEYLKAHGCEYDRYDSDTIWDEAGHVISLNHHQIVVYHDGDRSWDAICHEGSYGYEKGLLEIYGDIVWADIDGDSVAGWLTAQDVINRIEHGSEGARRDGKQGE